MIGLILVAASWCLLRLEGKRLTELGFNAPRRRALQLSVGFLVAGSVVVVQKLSLSAAAGVDWERNPDVDMALVLRGLRLVLNSVLYEELVFRGYLLYQAIRWLGPRRGVLLGAAAFGVYHWFSYGVFGAPVSMAFVFVLTGGFGLMTGLAFWNTGSVAAPIGLHLGWNAVAYLVFSDGPFGTGLLMPSDGAPGIEVPGVVGLALGLGLPLALVAGTSLYLLRREAGDQVSRP